MREAVLGAICTTTPPTSEQTVTIDGTLLDLQKNKTIRIPISSSDFLSPVSMAGDKDGKARFTVAINSDDNGTSQRSVSVWIRPTIREITQQSAILLPLFGAVGTFILWRTGRTIAESVPLGALIGTLGVFFVLLVRILAGRKQATRSTT